MGVFSSEKNIPLSCEDYSFAARALCRHFQQKGFETKAERRITGNWEVDITRGSFFKSICGLKTALKVQINGSGGQTSVKAGVGIFGQQAVPTVISVMFFWPVLLTQIWGLISQAQLDDEAIDVVERSLRQQAEGVPASTPDSTPALAAGVGKFCGNCGQANSGKGNFCTECGQSLELA